MDTADSSHLLAMTLDAAVPLWTFELRGRSFAELQTMAREAATIIASKGDIILYRSKKPGETAAAFNILAKAVAILSFFPGGVKVFGRHWVAQHPECPPQPDLAV